MPFVPNGRGGYCKIKNKNYEGAYVTLLTKAPYGAASGGRHVITAKDKAYAGSRARVIAVGTTKLHFNLCRKVATVQLKSTGESVPWPFNWWQDPLDTEDDPVGFAAPTVSDNHIMPLKVAETPGEMLQALNQDISIITAEMRGDEVAELPADPCERLTQEQAIARLNDCEGEQIFTLEVHDNGTRELRCSRNYYHGSWFNEHLSYGGGLYWQLITSWQRSIKLARCQCSRPLPLEPFKLAIAAGVDVNAPRDGDESPLHYALSKESRQFEDPEWVQQCGSRADFVTALLEGKADPDQKANPVIVCHGHDEDEITPLAMAADLPGEEAAIMVQLLKHYGATIQAPEGYMLCDY